MSGFRPSLISAFFIAVVGDLAYAQLAARGFPVGPAALDVPGGHGKKGAGKPFQLSGGTFVAAGKTNALLFGKTRQGNLRAK